MFFPGGDTEDLDEPFGMFAVSVQLPSGRAGPAPGLAELVHRRQEVRLAFHGDGEVHGDQYRPSIGLWVESEPGVGPVNGGLGVEVAGLGEPPEHAGHGRREQRDGRSEDRRPQPGPVGGDAPEKRTGGLRARERDHVEGHAAGPNPRRQYELELGLQGRRHRHPGHAAEQHGRQGNGKAGDQGDHRQHCGVEQPGGSENPVCGQSGGHRSEHHGAEDGAGPECAEQSTVAVSSDLQMLAGDHRQQCPQRHGRSDEHDRPQQDASYDWFVPDVAAAGAQRGDEPFPARGGTRRAAPPEQCNGEEDDGGGVQCEHNGNSAEVGDHHAGEGRSYCPGHVDADEIQSGSRPKLRPRNELGKCRPPSGQ